MIVMIKYDWPLCLIIQEHGLHRLNRFKRIFTSVDIKRFVASLKIERTIRLEEANRTKINLPDDAGQLPASFVFAALCSKKIIMAYAIAQQKKERVYKANATRSFIGRFFQWAADQDAEHHIVWAGVSLTLMAAVLFPFTMAAILFNGASFALIVAAISALALVLIVNLAAMPTRYSIPALLLGILINAAAVIISFCI